MVFEAKEVNATLELVSISGEKKSFLTKERVTSIFAEKVFHEKEVYEKAQLSLPEDERDKMLTYYSKVLSWIYKDLDTAWMKEEFTNIEIKEMYGWAMDKLVGVKKEDES